MLFPAPSSRLFYRPFVEEDLNDLFAMYSDLEVTHFLPGLRVSTLDEQRAMLPRLLSTVERYGEGFGVWAAKHRETGELVGTLLLKHIPDHEMNLTALIEVGWHLHRPFWKQGYAVEMGQAALEHGFVQKALQEIIAVVDPDNTASARVAERLGMLKEGSTKDFYGGEEVVLFRIQRHQWRKTSS